MADTKISGLPASTTPLAGTEVLPIVQSSTTKQVSVANLTAGRAVATGALTVTGAATVSTTLAVTGNLTSLNLRSSGGATTFEVGYSDLSAATVYRNGSDAGPNLLQVFAAGSKKAEFSSTALALQTGVSLTGGTSGTGYSFSGSAPANSLTLDSSGNVGIGATANASAILDAQSTTKGVRMPNMTTTQKNAISSPAAGLMVFDTTLAKLSVYSGTAWQTITSV